MYGLDKEISQIASAYQGKEGELQQQYGVTQDLKMLLALNKMKAERDAAIRNSQMQQQTPNATVKDQLIQEANQPRKPEQMLAQMAPQMQRNAQMQGQRPPQQPQQPQRPPQSGIASMQQRPPQTAATGGLMKAYQNGGEVKSYANGGVTGLDAVDQATQLAMRLKDEGWTYEDILAKGSQIAGISGDNPVVQRVAQAFKNLPDTQVSEGAGQDENIGPPPPPAATPATPAEPKSAGISWLTTPKEETLANVAEGVKSVFKGDPTVNRPQIGQMSRFRKPLEEELDLDAMTDSRFSLDDTPTTIPENVSVNPSNPRPPSLDPQQVVPDVNRDRNRTEERRTTTTSTAYEPDMTKVNEILEQQKGLASQYQNIKPPTDAETLKGVMAVADETQAPAMTEQQKQARVTESEEKAKARLGVEEFKERSRAEIQKLQKVYDAQNDPQARALERLAASLASMAGSSSLSAGLAKGAITSLQLKADQRRDTASAAKTLMDAMRQRDIDVVDLETQVLNMGQQMYKTLTATQDTRASNISAMYNQAKQSGSQEANRRQKALSDAINSQSKSMEMMLGAELKRLGIRSNADLQRLSSSRDGLIQVGLLMEKMFAGEAAMAESILNDPNRLRALRSGDEVEIALVNKETADLLAELPEKGGLKRSKEFLIMLGDVWGYDFEPIFASGAKNPQDADLKAKADAAEQTDYFD